MAVASAVAFAVAFALASAACSPSERRATDDSAAALPSDSLSGTRVDGDERMSWIARRDGAGLRIDETAHFGDDGTAHRRFTFDDRGRLRSATEERAQTVQFSDRSPARQTVRLTLRITAAGDSAVKQVDGASSPVRPYEIENLRRHADALVALVALAAGRGAPTPTPDTIR